MCIEIGHAVDHNVFGFYHQLNLCLGSIGKQKNNILSYVVVQQMTNRRITARRCRWGTLATVVVLVVDFMLKII